MSQHASKPHGRDNPEAHAIRLCLDQLVTHAEAQGFTLAANLIGAASRAISDEIIQNDAARTVVQAINSPGPKLN